MENIPNDIQILHSLNDILKRFSSINVDKLIHNHEKKDDLFLVDLIYVHNWIKHKTAKRIGKWLKSFISGDVALFLRDEYGIFENLYDTNDTTVYIDFFKTHPYDIRKEHSIYHFPIFSEDRLFGVCIVEDRDDLDEIKLEYIKVALNTASILLKDIYR